MCRHPKKIAVLRALKLGDLLCATPAFRALRGAFPESEITLISLPWASEFAGRFSHFFNNFIEFPGFPGLTEVPFDPKKFLRFLSEVQQEHFDFVLQLHGRGEHVNDLVGLFGAKYQAGYFLSSHWCPDRNTFIEYPDELPESWKHLKLMKFLGIPLKGEELEFPLFQEDFLRLKGLLTFSNTDRNNYVCIHLGAISGEKWSIAHFKQVAQALRWRGLNIVITGSAHERHLGEELAHGLEEECVINLAGQTDLGLLGSVIASSSLFLSHDTGVSHLAAALRVPSVIVANKSDREGGPPLDRVLHRFLCRMEGVTPELVIQEIDDLLTHEGKGNSIVNNEFLPSFSYQSFSENVCVL